MTSIFVPLLSLNWTDSLQIGLPATAGLASIALVGYLFGKRTRQDNQVDCNSKQQQELEQATGIAHQLESIADRLRQDLANHHGRLAQFQQRLAEARSTAGGPDWKQLGAEAESMLSPTTQLAEKISLAYDAIRQQSDALETFSQTRTDPKTGVGNSRALEEKIDVLLAAARRSDAGFAVALVSLDRDSIASHGDGNVSRVTQLRELARLIQSCKREHDYVARYGDDEFAIVMPQTKLAGACLFGEQLLRSVIERMDATANCGVAEYQDGDDRRSLLSRADSAFYSAKAAGGNRLFVHTGTQIRESSTAAAPRGSDASRWSPMAPLDGAAGRHPTAAVPVAIG